MSAFGLDLKILMDTYNTAREKWIKQYGSDDGFDAWVINKLEGK